MNKKVLAIGVSGLLMLGAASQAAAAWEKGNFTMSVFDTKSNQEMGIDLGAIADLSAEGVVLVSGLTFTDWDFAQSGIGIFSDNSRNTEWYHEGWIATTRADGVDFSTTFANAQGFFSNEKSVRFNYALEDGRDMDIGNGITVISAENAASYSVTLNINAGQYMDVNRQAGVEAKLSNQDVDLYLYHFTTDASYNIVQDMSGNLAGQAYDAKFTLTSDGKVILNQTSDVPVPGAIWLLGSGLAGLAGIRRRKNS